MPIDATLGPNGWTVQPLGPGDGVGLDKTLTGLGWLVQPISGGGGGGGVAPGAVTGVTAGAATPTTQPLTWTAPTTGDLPITYTVGYRLTSAGGVYSTAASGISGTSYTVTGLTASTAYDYQVTPTNATGSGTAGLLGNVSTLADGTALPQTASIVARWSADALPVVADGTAVASWTDSVGGFAATQATGGLQPVYKTNQVGGKPSLRFPGTAILDAGRPAALISALDQNTNRTIFVVHKPLGATSQGMIFSAANGSGGGIMFVASQTKTGRFNAEIPDTTTGFKSAAWVDAVVGGTGVQRDVINGGIARGTQGTAPTTGAFNVSFGGIVSSGTFKANVDIFEVIVWSRALTPPELIQAHMWACDKYSQAYPFAALPAINVYDCDSITMGSGSTPGNDYPFKAAALAGLPFGAWTNVGIGGTTITGNNTKAPAEVDPIPALTGKYINLHAFEWYNQRGIGYPATQVASDAYIAARRAASIKTRLIWGTSTCYATPDATRVSYNSYYDANHASLAIDGYAPIHDNTEIGAEGAYAANPGNFSDVVHPTNAGYTVLASIFHAAYLALPPL